MCQIDVAATVAARVDQRDNIASRYPMKLLRWIVLGVVLLVVIVLAIVYFNLNGIVRRTVQSQSAAQLNTQTTLNSASVSIFGGSLGLHDFQISSPPGFPSPKMLLLDE